MDKGLLKPCNNYVFLKTAESQLNLNQQDVFLNGHRKLIVSVSVPGVRSLMGCIQLDISGKREKAVNNTIVTVEGLLTF